MLVRKIYSSHRLPRLELKENTSHPLVPMLYKQLAARGFLTPGQTGAHVWNEALQEALINFQEAENLPSQGIIDPITYCRLSSAQTMEVALRPKNERANPSLARANILIAKSQRRLTLFDGNNPIRQYPVAIGKPATPTPVGNFAIAVKVMNPGGILGTRWMGLNYDSYGIHGTNKPWLIGQMVSLGCIRMHNHNIEELYALVRIGTPVYIRD